MILSISIFYKQRGHFQRFYKNKQIPSKQIKPLLVKYFPQ